MFFDRPEAGRKAVVLHVHFRASAAQSDEVIDDASALAECVELARTAEVDVVDTVTATRDHPHPRAFVGSGKLEELRQRMRMADADLLIVNHELGAGQQRNLEQDLKCRVITRTELILTIFADRARTYEGQLQVELAQLKHAQTRLVRGWTHLDRQKGGIGLRGAGETQLELDQRMLGERIKTTERKLDQVARRRALGRRRRERSKTPTVSLVGYTNAGKSTLFNSLTTAEVLSEDKLFATLDPTMRRLQIDGVGEVVLADTVGFISKLPHSLIEAFKATLEEVAGADLLLHVVDGASPGADARINEVNAVLGEIGALELPTLLVLNKMDLAPEDRELLDVRGVEVSALTGQGLAELKQAIADALGVSAPMEVLIAPEDGRTRAWLYRIGAVIDEQTAEDGRVAMKLRADPVLIERLEALPTVLLQPAEPVHKLSPLAS
ncbi:MAG: GTPase HflX [Gammaproteobacteria bacterium]|nr:MAG: GTPase HflX [Gammaproteobacteria bacterium]